ncbi:uncharacterized protein [Rhodnius prolixus]|uniref:uncharacterized protein n=1 Tax=Rhodnius prolixus TaxID=13249 RepID=UPI003D18EF77
MHYGLLLLSMCIAFVYSSPLSRYEQQLDLLSRYRYEFVDNLEKLSQTLAHFHEDFLEKNENTSESNIDPIFKPLSVESEDISNQQVDNEVDNLEKLSQTLAHFHEDFLEKNENTSESNIDPISKSLSVESEDTSNQQVDNEKIFQDDSDEIKVNLIR